MTMPAIGGCPGWCLCGLALFWGHLLTSGPKQCQTEYGPRPRMAYRGGGIHGVHMPPDCSVTRAWNPNHFALWIRESNCLSVGRRAPQPLE